MDEPAPPKPLLRGVLHQGAILVAIAAGVYLVVHAKNERAAWAGGAYAASLVVLFSVSAAYHRINWSPEKRALMRRADHAMIFTLIAGTYTPFMLVAMPQPIGARVLIFVWGASVVGIVQSLFWIKAPKAVTAILAVAVGWCGVFYWDEVAHGIDWRALVLLAAGGVVYTAGAVVYAVKKPVLWPEMFGYHELFHLCTVIAAVLHFFSVCVVVL